MEFNFHYKRCLCTSSVKHGSTDLVCTVISFMLFLFESGATTYGGGDAFVNHNNHIKDIFIIKSSNDNS